MKTLLAACVLLPLGGCTVGPNYHPPQTAMPQAYGALSDVGTAPSLSAPISTTADLSRWWTRFGDAELQRLVSAALTANLDFLTAASRVRESRSQETIAGAAGLPRVTASGLGARLHSNSNIAASLGGGSASSAGNTAAASDTDITLYSLGFDASWELDLFGGVRRGVEAARARTAAALWTMRDSEVSLTAEIATDYFALRTAQARMKLLRDDLDRQRNILTLAASRARFGFVTQVDVNQQRALMESTSAQIPELEVQIRASEHALAVLVGANPDALVTELDSAAALPGIPPFLPVGLPSDLLQRRPDIRASERQLAAATANIGVAVADLYPKFNLLGGASLASNSLSKLFSSDSLGAFGLGDITMPIFTGGQVHANIAAKKEEAQQAFYAYRKTVLTAVQESEDAIERYGQEQQRFLALQKSAEAARASAHLISEQYRTGLVPYVNVLIAQTNALSADDQAVQGRAALSADLVALFKALGGGWDDSDVEVVDSTRPPP